MIEIQYAVRGLRGTLSKVRFVGKYSLVATLAKYEYLLCPEKQRRSFVSNKVGIFFSEALQTGAVMAGYCQSKEVNLI